MRRLFTISFLCLLVLNAFGQAPEKFNYQGVARDANSNILANQNISLRFSIINGSNANVEYQEDWYVQTNDLGLFNVEIGGGLWVQGSISGIDWGATTYGLKVEMDPAGGTNFQNMGASQLLSVPYALYAQNTPPDEGYHPGDFAQGGIVFWVDNSGQHGLVCDKQDLGVGPRWYLGTYGNTYATGDGPFSGEMNTMLMIAGQMAIGNDGGGNAATYCTDLEVTQGSVSYADWYLPSKDELAKMYQNRVLINSVAQANSGNAFSTTDAYWTSTEYSNTDAYIQNFGTGASSHANKSGFYAVRAIRSF
ncbi:MAG: DUF1566 domain-containing protein [Flavobacteriales bacterium]|nr:DUF1566 domain-containing protein [Flavobacteriales bacterium]